MRVVDPELFMFLLDPLTFLLREAEGWRGMIEYLRRDFFFPHL
jgi:hypothetical protein